MRLALLAGTALLAGCYSTEGPWIRTQSSLVGLSARLEAGEIRAEATPAAPPDCREQRVEPISRWPLAIPVVTGLGGVLLAASAASHDPDATTGDAARKTDARVLVAGAAIVGVSLAAAIGYFAGVPQTRTSVRACGPVQIQLTGRESLFSCTADAQGRCTLAGAAAALAAEAGGAGAVDLELSAEGAAPRRLRLDLSGGR